MKLKNEKVVVCGGGGFIGGHLVSALLNNGVNVARTSNMNATPTLTQSNVVSQTR